MRRILGLAAIATAVLTPVLAVSGTASAAPGELGPISASAGKVALGSNPWVPTGELRVTVTNEAETEQKGFFLLRLPTSATLESSKLCKPVEERAWKCGGDPVAPGGKREYTVAITSTIPEPVFGRSDEGFVQGQTEAGVGGGRTIFTIAWPDRLPLRLAATSKPVANGTTDVDVKVTNAGTFTMGGYSLMVKTPKGVTVVSPACSDSGRMGDAGCELYRDGQLKAGDTDQFTVRLKVTSTPVTVELFLAPTNRYTNKDTRVDLVLKAAAQGGGGGTGGNEPTLPVTGSRTNLLIGTGAGLVVLGAGLLLALRRRRVVIG
jgi:LPXTG-motif cell wall-anchored protein